LALEWLAAPRKCSRRGGPGMICSMASEMEKGSGEIWINMAKYGEMLLKDESYLW